MKELPKTINNTEELEELLSRPSEKLIDFMTKLDGDIMVIGAGGKMGPTMATMAKRALDAANIDKKVIAVDKENQRALLGAGLCFSKIGENEKARIIIEKLLSINPEERIRESAEQLLKGIKELSGEK